jgi:hypothetical protein
VFLLFTMQAEKAQIKNIPDNPKPNPGDSR